MIETIFAVLIAILIWKALPYIAALGLLVIGDVAEARHRIKEAQPSAPTRGEVADAIGLDLDTLKPTRRERWLIGLTMAGFIAIPVLIAWWLNGHFPG